MEYLKIMIKIKPNLCFIQSIAKKNNNKHNLSANHILHVPFIKSHYYKWNI